MFESVNGIHEYCIRNEQTFMSNITPEVLTQLFHVPCNKAIINVVFDNINQANCHAELFT